MVVVIIYFFHRRPIDVKRSLNLCLFLNSESCLMSVLLFGSLSSLKLWFFPHWLYAFVTRYEEMEISRKREHVICLAGFFPQFSFYHTVDFFAGQYNVLTSFFLFHQVLDCLTRRPQSPAHTLRYNWSSTPLCLSLSSQSNEHECLHICANDFE